MGKKKKKKVKRQQLLDSISGSFPFDYMINPASSVKGLDKNILKPTIEILYRKMLNRVYEKILHFYHFQ